MGYSSKSKRRPGKVVVPTLVLILASPIGAGDSAFRRADVNADGLITLTDAVTTFTYLLAMNELICTDAADFNDDGAVDVVDVVASLHYMFLAGGTPPAPPYPGCGSDPSPDGLSCDTFPTCP